ncbi:hypothetical protein [Pseudomonas sp. Marseille-Q1929]|uniref:hypothetical protein n=1 Tax=Pseudomonas sp. Marseille-Q1929 TaxID=2730402 RepID=UPI001A8E8BCB|nr:hypothetical protein [Pseudomonas sp. Marseille-Q1929]MBO0494093.1 hypothetical protein [Pseudomonas sp. Marseille-Q1929]
MKTNLKTPSTQGTTGTLTAHVNNPQAIPADHDYVGDPDRMLMLQVGGEFRMHSTQVTGPTPNQNLGFDFRMLSASVPADGVERSYIFPQDASSHYWAYENGGSQPYEATSGQLRLALHPNERAVGSFDFVGQAGTKSVTVTNGKFDLLGFTTSQSIRQGAPVQGVGSFNGTFVGGPASPQFNAQQVSIQRFDLGGVPVYYDVQGRVIEAFPQRDTFVSILVDEGATGQTFDLATSTEARVSFFDFPDHGFAYAIAGTLTFTSKPDSGRAVGTLSCTFRKNSEPTFTFTGTFDITA